MNFPIRWQEASLRAAFIIRWPGSVPASKINNEIVHVVDLYTTPAHIVARKSRRIARLMAWIS